MVSCADTHGQHGYALGILLPIHHLVLVAALRAVDMNHRSAGIYPVSAEIALFIYFCLPLYLVLSKVDVEKLQISNAIQVDSKRTAISPLFVSLPNT